MGVTADMLEQSQACLGKYSHLGFYLVEDEDIVSLYFEGTLIGRFSATGVNVANLCLSCEGHLNRIDTTGRIDHTSAGMRGQDDKPRHDHSGKES